jgi:DNA-directed RNA polymerase specialized sigma24 family protein
MMTHALLDRARAGDTSAFAELTEPYRQELQLHCYRMLGTVADSEDLVQDTLLSAWRAMADFRGQASVRTWLYRIATNRCLNALRDRGRRPAAATLPASGPVPPEPSRLGEAMWLEPYPDVLLGRGAEAADMLGTTQDAVASGLKRARATLAARTHDERARRPPLPASAAEQRVISA